MSAGLAVGTMRATVWNARAALLYSLGGWTMLGAMLHYSSNSGGAESSAGVPGKESNPQANQSPHKEVFTRETALGFEVTTVITYRDVQPPVTRLLRCIKSFFDPNDSPPNDSPPSEN